MRCAVHYVLFAYWIILLIRVFSSWFRPPMSEPWRTLLSIVYDLTDPSRPSGWARWPWICRRSCCSS